MSQLQSRDQQTVQTVLFPRSIQRAAGSGATPAAARMGERAEQDHGAHRQAATGRARGSAKWSRLRPGGASPAWE